MPQLTLANLLGSKVRQELFAGQNPLGSYLRISGQRYRVIGVMEPKGQILGFDMDDTVIIPAARALELFNRPGLMEIHLSYKPSADLQSVVRGIKGGAEDYLPKPFEPTLLHARISSSLEKKRLRDQQRDLIRKFAESANDTAGEFFTPRDVVRLMVQAVREGFAVLKALGVPVTPSKLTAFNWLPLPLLVSVVPPLTSR